MLLCARDAKLLESARTELATQAAPDQRVAAQAADVSDLDEVRNLFETARRALPSLDGVVNNAGVLGPRGLAEDADPDDWWKTLEVNLRGTFNMCSQALPEFRRKARGKIVNLSGGGATSPMPHFSAYAASKSAVVRFTETLAVEAAGSGVDINAVAPGALNTRMLEQVLTSGPAKVGASYYDRSLKQKEDGGASLENAAALCVFLLSAASDGLTGLLISAVWDPWRKLAEHTDRLAGSDVYKLRRVVPADRGMTLE